MSPSRKPLLAGVLLLALAAASFFPILDNGFINYDDPSYVLENRHVRQGFTPGSIGWALTAFHASNWHPLTWLSHQLDVMLWGLDPFGHHLTSLLLHLVNAALVLAFLRAITGLLWPSFLVATLFAVHPLHVESVAWVAERKDVLSTLFGLLALLAYLCYVRRPGQSRYAAAVLLFTLGLSAKPMLVTLPLLLLVLDWWPMGRGHAPGTARRILLEKIPLLALAAIASLLTLRAQADAVASILEYSLKARMGNALLSYAHYLGRTLLPTRLAPFYPHPGEDLPLAHAVIALSLLIGSGWISFAVRRRRPYLLAGVLFYLLTLIPVIGLVQVGGQAMADRYTYLPLLGPLLAAAWSLVDLAVGARRGMAVAVSGALLLICLGAIANRQTRHWKDSITLFTHATSVTRENWLAHANLAFALDAAGRPSEASAHFKEALRINPAFAKASVGLGAVLARQGSLAEARMRFLQALRYDPGSADAFYNLGSVCADENLLEDAVAYYRKALALNPELPEGWNNLGIALARMGRLQEASEAFRKSIALSPGDADARYNLMRAVSHSRRHASDPRSESAER